MNANVQEERSWIKFYEQNSEKISQMSYSKVSVYDVV